MIDLQVHLKSSPPLWVGVSVWLLAASARWNDCLHEACRDVVHVPGYANAIGDRICRAETLDVTHHSGRRV